MIFCKVRFKYFRNVHFSVLILPTWDPSNCDLREAIFDGANLSGANIMGAPLDGATFVNANLDDDQRIQYGIDNEPGHDDA